MNTPLASFLDAYAQKGALRLHMPGHKGKLDPSDITEIPGADVLYCARGAIRESEENAARLFGAARTFYSAEGSSLCIRAMLAAARSWAEKEKLPRKILALRNAHQSFLTAAALLDLEIAWLLPENSTLLSCPLTPEALENALERERVFAVYLTSPDYLGALLPIASLARVCREKGVLLLCDNAHGAYLRFLPGDLHPLTLGADLSCDSAHKTLSALTGAAYLHVSPSAPSYFCEAMEKYLALFASTSPSYLILRSLDLLNARLASDFRQLLAAFLPAVDSLKESLRSLGFSLLGDEPLKLTLAPRSYGYTGREVFSYLRENGVEPEMADGDVLVLMFTPENGASAPGRVWELMKNLPRRAALASSAPPLPPPGKAYLSPREALLAPSRRVPLSRALGAVLASPCVSCPPAVPVALCGERLTQVHLDLFAYYGVDEVEIADL